MSSKGRQKETLRSLSRQSLHDDDIESYHSELLNASDRACALVGAATVEHALSIAIIANFVELDEERENQLFWNPTSPLGSLSSKIQMAFALGVYDGYFSTMVSSVKDIRNVFAHALRPINFQHPLVKTACDKLPRTEHVLKSGAADPLTTERRRYIATCIQLANVLKDYAEKRRVHGVKTRAYLIKQPR